MRRRLLGATVQLVLNVKAGTTISDRLGIDNRLPANPWAPSRPSVVEPGLTDRARSATIRRRARTPGGQGTGREAGPSTGIAEAGERVRPDYARSYRTLWDRHWWWRSRERFLLGWIGRLLRRGTGR